MDTLIVVVKYMFLTIAVGDILYILFKKENTLSTAVFIWKHFTFKIFIQSVFLLFCVIMFNKFIKTHIHVLEYGWADIFIEGGGNISIAPIIDLAAAPNAMYQIIPILFTIGFLLCVPYLAKYEEEIFRKWCTTWSNIWKTSILFGLVHCIVGVSLSVGISIIIPGLFYGYLYKKTYFKYYNPDFIITAIRAKQEAITLTTTYHTMNNTIVGIILFIYFLCKFVVLL